MTTKPASEVAMLLDLLDQAFEKKSWHGANLKGSIRGLTLDELLWRPAPGRRNIWEHVVHAAYWKYTVWRRLTGERRGSFGLKGSNWIPRDSGLDAAAWRADLRMLDDVHRKLHDVIARLTPNDLAWTPRASKVSNLAIITGIAHHDVYHTGQIQLLKRLSRARRNAQGRP
jgi:uncharacterized damage-inducible protein DinB